MASTLSGKLSGFVGSDEDMFANPYQSTSNEDKPKKKQRIEDDEDDYKPKKKKKKSTLEKVLEYGKQLEEDLYDDGAVGLLDRYLSDFAGDEEDIDLRNSLISKGRKYARETKVTPESSEVAKAFSGNEKMIREIIDEVSTDIAMIQNDVNQMRSLRTGRNNKALTDMIMNKKELYGIKMNAVKELNSMKKTEYDIQSKIQKNMPSETGDSDSLVNRAIGSMLGSGRSAALNAVGGYSGVSGAIGADEDYTDNRAYDNDDEDDEDDGYNDSDDGDAFIKYEGRGVNLVLTEGKNGDYRISAEDRDGVEIPDYPIPRQNPASLNFRVNEKLHQASDAYHRKYIYRREE